MEMLPSGLTVTGLEAVAWVVAVVAAVALLLSPQWFVSAFTARGTAVEQPALERADGQSSQLRQQTRPRYWTIGPSPVSPSRLRQPATHPDRGQHHLPSALMGVRIGHERTLSTACADGCSLVRGYAFHQEDHSRHPLPVGPRRGPGLFQDWWERRWLEETGLAPRSARWSRRCSTDWWTGVTMRGSTTRERIRRPSRRPSIQTARCSLARSWPTLALVFSMEWTNVSSEAWRPVVLRFKIRSCTECRRALGWA